MILINKKEVTQMDNFCEAQKMIQTLDDKFEFYAHSLIAITGGGGKTSLLLALGRYFAEKERTVVTTTTKIYIPSLFEYPNQIIGSPQKSIEAVEALPRCSLLVAAKEQHGEKLVGYTTSEINELMESGIIDKVIVESDGSRGLSLKAYEEWEPPVPTLTTCQIIILGADVFKTPMSGSTVFRFDLLHEKYGIQQGECLSVANCSAILSSSSGYLKNSPDSAYRVLFINKCELLSESELDELSEKLSSSLKGYDALVTASIKADTIYKLAKLDRE